MIILDVELDKLKCNQEIRIILKRCKLNNTEGKYRIKTRTKYVHKNISQGFKMVIF